jgi:2-polyprenyl-3-methyl-5-hydroxy-6-metoxy-1,4-benzoquinol methylase
MSSLRIRYQTLEFGDVDIHLRTLRDRQQFRDVGGVAEDLGICSGKRILEVGCGIGLASLVLNHRGADITATDRHPEVGNYLTENVQLNDGKEIPFVRTGWADPDSGLGEFDFIVGSDLLYEREHVELLAAFIDRHAKPACDVMLVDPGRRHHARFSKRMVTLGYSHSQSKLADMVGLDQPFGGQVLRYAR